MIVELDNNKIGLGSLAHDIDGVSVIFAMTRQVDNLFDQMEVVPARVAQTESIELFWDKAVGEEPEQMIAVKKYKGYGRRHQVFDGVWNIWKVKFFVGHRLFAPVV